MVSCRLVHNKSCSVKLFAVSVALSVLTSCCQKILQDPANLLLGNFVGVVYFFFSFVRKSLDLIESLLRLAEVGQYEQVKQLFSFPIKHCPDMLVLALLQINTSWHTLRHELISTLMPIFLGNHPNSAIILHYAWHGQVSIFTVVCSCNLKAC